jgi:hypothetical protein
MAFLQKMNQFPTPPRFPIECLYTRKDMMALEIEDPISILSYSQKVMSAEQPGHYRST